MRLIILCLGVVCVMALLPTTVLSQVMLEHAISAAGGSVAGVAGKGVSNSIDKIFGKLRQQKQNEAEMVRRMEPQPAGGETAVGEPAQAGILKAVFSNAGAGETHSQETAKTHEQSAPEPAEWWITPQREPVRSSEDLAAIETGATREDVVGRMGAPSARIFIPEEGSLREVYLYNSGGEHLGKVTLTDGEVDEVQVQQ